MKVLWLLGLLAFAPEFLRASERYPEPPRHAVFGGSASSLPVPLHTTLSPGPAPEVLVHRLQLATSTAAALETLSLGPIPLPAGLLLLDSPPVPFPAVRAPTRFLVQWLTKDGQRLGSTEVEVYPTNLLAELAPLAGGLPIGLLDPQHQLQPRLQALHIRCVDLTRSDLADFEGRLAIFGPFSHQHPAPPDLARDLHTRSKHPLAAVWLTPPADTTSPGSPLVPSFHVVQLGRATVVVAQGDLVRDLTLNPRAQQTLTLLARHAVRPRAFGLPESPTRYEP